MNDYAMCLLCLDRGMFMPKYVYIHRTLGILTTSHSKLKRFEYYPCRIISHSNYLKYLVLEKHNKEKAYHFIKDKLK